MSFSRNQIIIIGIGAIIIIVIVLIFLGVIPGLQTPGSQTQEVKLTIWGIEDENSFQGLIDDYEKIRPNVKVSYAKIPENNFENNLISSLAAGRSPDIFMFENRWLAKHIDKIVPAADSQFTTGQMEQFFPQAVKQNFERGGKIYALPLYIDTLALLYNKDIFDSKAIALPPTTWQSFTGLIPILRDINQLGQITKSAAAIGGSEQSVSRATDLLNNIFAQFGNPVIGADGGIRFDENGQKALNFYLQFANPASAYYTWSNDLPYSLDAFGQGKVAMIFNYASSIPKIKNKNPFINIGIAAMPQFSGASQPTTFAGYWGLAVSKQSRNPDYAWDFIVNTTANAPVAENYLKAGSRPPALRVLINKYINDPNLGVFARQALTARSWPEPDSAAVKQIFSNMIESVLTGKLSAEQALRQAENQINGLK